MEMKKLPIKELRTFLLAVSEHGEQHLAEVDADLQQTTFLLNEAIEKLGSSFMAVYQLVEAQRAAFDEVRKLNDFPQSGLDILDEYQQKIGDEVNAVVTGMQFQDMTNQLLQRTIKRVNGLKELLLALAEHGHEMSADKEHEDIVQFINNKHKTLHQGSQALTGGLRRAVDQQNMTTGDIDLF
jgi:chemotaxis regulatin CheY-phosphate phosphatase CheZ